ncbi:MAG: phosphatidylserine decarboxylase [Phycisphaerae bacterium]|nr:phosphatidylserine decarboxylase [Phycisphaerae bacterium]NIW92859.1 phosphatidylserine decarboxylase [Phycisphaerae bacterium]
MIEILQLIRIASASRQDKVSLDDRQKAIAIINWQREILKEAISQPGPLQPSVQALSDYLNCDTGNSIARMYATKMLEESKLEWFVFDNIEQWLRCINYVIQRAPEYDPDPNKQFFFPMSTLFVFFMYTPSGSVLFRLEEFNQCLAAVLQAWCDYLNSSESRLVLNPTQQIPAQEGWLSPASQKQFCLEQCINYENRDNPEMPYWGFLSYNDFFHREINLEAFRPLAGPGDDKVIVSANDGTVYRIARDVEACAEFWAKGQNYSLIDMLDNSPYTQSFIHGDVLQSFLDGSDYHRWHAPISGQVLEARIIPGLTFSELLSEGFDLSAGTKSQGYEAMVNTRALIIIENPAIGKVAVLPIGITEISSITIMVQEGQQVQKGAELGYFSYGGSSLALVFQANIIQEFTAKEPSNQGNGSTEPCKTAENCKAEDGCLRVRAKIAIAK